jgi:hypothetical protein
MLSSEVSAKSECEWTVPHDAVDSRRGRLPHHRLHAQSVVCVDSLRRCERDSRNVDTTPRILNPAIVRCLLPLIR